MRRVECYRHVDCRRVFAEQTVKGTDENGGNKGNRKA